MLNKFDVKIGNQTNNIRPMTTQDGLFLPGGLAFDGHYLWIAELKFSNRVLRYTVH